MKGTYILAIESSCDETAAAVVKDGRTVLSNVISSQIALHTLYGGVVPEIASRKHIEHIIPVILEALKEAHMSLAEMDAVAVTYGPGLVGSLLVGVGAAKAIAYAAKKPLIGVHHIEGHVAANYLSNPELEPPFLCLIVSGGHTHLVMIEDYGSYRILGRTHDDAAGEAYDKVARAIGLGYPGGPKIDRLAKEGNPEAIAFPRAHIEGNPYDFSFSGVKSAVLNYLNGCKMKASVGEPEHPAAMAHAGEADYLSYLPEGVTQADIAASFQAAVVDVLVTRTVAAAKAQGIGKVALAGGVASNSALRGHMREVCEANGLSLYYPEPILCTDNAAMIGSAAYYEYCRGVSHDWTLNAVPNLKLGE